MTSCIPSQFDIRFHNNKVTRKLCYLRVTLFLIYVCCGLQKSGLLVDKYYTPVLCLLGALGNILSLAVFCLDSKFKSQSSAYYLSALAVSDTGYLLNLFVFWLEDVLQVNSITNPVMCPLVMYLGQVTCFISVYLMVAFSIERYVAVHYPFSRLKYCTHEVSRKVTFSIVSVAMVIFSYALVIAQVIEKKPKTTNSIEYNFTLLNNSYANFTFSPYIDLYNNSNTTFSDVSTAQQSKPVFLRCSVPKQYYKISEIANYSDTAVTLLIPVVLIACLNIRICFSVRKIMMERKNIVASDRRRSTLAIEDDESMSSMIQSKLVIDNQDVSCKRKQSSVRFQNIHGENTSRKSSRALKCEESTACRILQERARGRKQQPNCEMKVTKTLLLVSTVFLCLHLPLHTIRCAKFITYMRGIKSGKKLLRALEPWGNLLFNTNFAINFILYYTSGRNFRETLKHLLPFARFQRKRQPNMISSRYRHSVPNYTTELSTLEGRNALGRKSISSRRNTRSDSAALRKDLEFVNCQTNSTGNILKTNTDCADNV